MKILNLGKIQKTIDHFGIGKLLKLGKSDFLKIEEHVINLYYIETNKGTYVISELPVISNNITKIQNEVDLKLNLNIPVFVYPENNKIQFAHVEDLYYSVRKIN